MLHAFWCNVLTFHGRSGTFIFDISFTTARTHSSKSFILLHENLSCQESGSALGQFFRTSPTWLNPKFYFYVTLSFHCSRRSFLNCLFSLPVACHDNCSIVAWYVQNDVYLFDKRIWKPRTFSCFASIVFLTGETVGNRENNHLIAFCLCRPT